VTRKQALQKRHVSIRPVPVFHHNLDKQKGAQKRPSLSELLL
jgi:hypothetical protein